MRKVILVGVVSLLLLLTNSAAMVLSQGGVSKWQRYDVNLTVQQNSGITVEEIHEVALVQGATTYQKVIPLDKLETVSNVQILELNPGGGQRGYQQANTQANYTFEVIPSGDEYTIQLHFPPNNVSSTRFVIRYFATGAVRFYDEGDILDWRPFGWSAGAPIDSSTTTIRLPSDVPQNQLVQSSTGPATEKFTPEPGRAIFIANGVSSGSRLDVSLNFPHGVVQGNPPAWQRVADTTPSLRWGSVIFAILLLILGLAAVFGWWYFKLRSPADTSEVPKYIRKPPSRLTPAIAGALLDGKANPNHIMATLLDLAAKGALNVYPIEKDEFGEDSEVKKEPTFNLYGVNQEKAVEAYESTLYGKAFGYMGARERKLSDIRRTLYMSGPEMKTQIDLEIAKAGYFTEEAQVARRQYAAFGGAGVLIAIVLALITAVVFSGLTFLAACPCLSFAVISLAVIGVGFAKSNRTEKGTKEAAKWEAFKRYMADMTPKQAAKARPVFARLLPYAVAFEVEKQMIESFVAANTATPKWWSIPEEKLHDVDHENAHAWVSETVMSKKTQEEPQPEKQQTKSVIKRLGTPDGDAKPGATLKSIQPAFMAFLKTGNDVFAKAPPLDHDEELSLEDE